jgi:uncharacterized membrane protein YqjE
MTLPDSSAGVVPELRALLGSVLQHVIGLISLAGWEGREASAHYLRLIVTLLSAVFFLLIGYLFFLLFFVFFLSHWLEVEWIWIALGIAVIHSVLAFIGLWVFIRNMSKPIFTSTFSEIKRDIEILRPPTQ